MTYKKPHYDIEYTVINNGSDRVMELHFIIAGFSKCGTTTLYSLLSDHPDIFMLPAKDNGFLANPDYQQHWDKYESLLDDVTAESVFGEANVPYGGSGSEIISRQRILKHFPNIKLIFLARDPIDRIESSFREYHHSGAKYGLECPFELPEALATFPSILDDTMYWTRIEQLP